MVTMQEQSDKSDHSWLSWTTMMLGGMLVLFLLVLSISTMDRLNRTSELMLDSLVLKGNLVVEYLESATRASLRGGNARVVMLSDMIQEVYNQAQLLSLTIIDQEKRVVVNFTKDDTASESLPAHISEDEWLSLKEHGYFAVNMDNNLLLGKTFDPFRYGRRPPLSSASGRSHHHQRANEALNYDYSDNIDNSQTELSQTANVSAQTWEGIVRLCASLLHEPVKLYALIKMSNYEIHQQIQRDMSSTILLALIIFAGCAMLAILLTWLVRNRNLEMQNMRRVIARNKHLAAVGRLAGTVAHEIRNPLSSLRGLVQLMAKNMPPESKEANYAKVAVDEVDRLERVVSSLLNYTQPRAPRFLALDLAESIGSVLQFIKDDTKAREVKLHLDLPQGLPLVEADPDLLRQVLLNLIINALEAINGAGNIWISAEAVDEHEYVLIRIKDDGPGLPKKEDIFDPFFSTKAQGSGLGLAIAQHIAKSHCGSLLARNSEGGGAILELKLKAVNEREHTGD
jgi:two-component system sensor histidine kinase HydH